MEKETIKIDLEVVASVNRIPTLVTQQIDLLDQLSEVHQQMKHLSEKVDNLNRQINSARESTKRDLAVAETAKEPVKRDFIHDSRHFRLDDKGYLHKTNAAVLKK